MGEEDARAVPSAFEDVVLAAGDESFAWCPNNKTRMPCCCVCVSSWPLSMSNGFVQI